ncbi:MAG: nitroreductase [Cytophagales bacterium]|nr:nitroreductase [Cytophagales bacterium]
MIINPGEINRLIRHRRSLYPAQYSGEVIDDAIIHQLTENANWAPTHGLTEPWRFVVFKGEGLQQLARFQSELYEEVTKAKGTFSEEKKKDLASKPLLASHVIAIGMKRDPRGKIPEIEEVEAVACAVQNMYLTASAYGLGAYWGSGGVTYWDQAKAFFGLEQQDKLLGFFYLGVPKTAWPEGKRGPAEQKVRWVV